jgi:hypothetical protein
MLGSIFGRQLIKILCKYAEFSRLYSVPVPGLWSVHAIVRAAMEEMVQIGASDVARLARELLGDCEE